MIDLLARVQGLSKTFSGHRALHCLNLELPQGEMIGIVGPDGAGKTTLLRMIAGLLIPDEGSVRVLGCDTVREAEQIHRFSGYMPQKFGLYEELTVIENLRLFASLKGLQGKELSESFQQLLKFTGLQEFQARRASALSGGMKQKLGLACTLIQKPKLLILDEPTVGVDPISRRELWQMVSSLLITGVSILWSTAYLNEAEKCHRIVLLNEGEVLYQGDPLKLTERVDGRVFLINDLPLDKRSYLHELELREDIADVLIQGSSIRVVTKTGILEKGTKISPRLEDAFVDLLGGKKSGKTTLSQKAPDVTMKKKAQAVSARHLVKRFGSFVAVNDITFDVKPGEIFGLLGPNGAGKSTTFKMLCGLLKPTAGEAGIDGIDLNKAPHLARAQLGYMAQKFSLYGNLTVKQNLEFFSGIYSAQGSVEEKLVLNDLEPFRDQIAETLPAGIKQKLALAVAVIHWPPLVFLDEPTSGMDPVSRREFWSQMNGLARKGTTILVSTHFMDEAENCDRIGLIYKGRVIHLDTPDGIKELARTEKLPQPSLEDAFVGLIERYDAAQV